MTKDDGLDAALIRAAVRGDEDAFAQLVRRHLRKAMAVAFEYTQTREDAEDVVQDTFRRVCESLHRFDAEKSFEPWFFTILRNVARNAAKSRRVRVHDAIDVEHAAQSPGPDDDVHRGQLRDQIGAAIQTLPPMQRSCFRLCVVEGLSSGEAAVALGISESTVRVHVFKARQTLQDLLGSWREEAQR